MQNVQSERQWTEGARRRGSGSSKHRTDPQQQFSRLKWFGEIVINANFETAHPILWLAASRQHENWHLRSSPQVGGEIEPALDRHHDVKHDDVEGQHVQKSTGLCGRGRNRDAMTVFDEKGGQQGAKPSIVVDHENMGGVVLERGWC